MNRMLPKVPRWRPVTEWARSGGPVRWSVWAGALVARYRRTVLRLAPAGTVLVYGWPGSHGGGGARLRPVRDSRTRPAARRPLTIGPPSLSIGNAARPPADGALAPPLRYNGSVRVVTAPAASPPMAPHRFVPGRAGVEAVVRVPAVGGHLVRPPVHGSSATLPVAVPRRLRPTTAADMGDRPRTGSLVHECRQVARRAVERRRRVESPTDRLMVPPTDPTRARAPRGWPPVDPPALALRRPERWYESRPAPAVWSPAAAPERHGPDRSSAGSARVEPLDIEHLTEQVVRRIEERITAHRERLGRI